MKPKGIFPGIQKAFHFVKERLDAGYWAQGELLPAIPALAIMAGVSRATMFRALGALKTQGLVSVHRGHRLKVGSLESAAPLPASKQLQWERTKTLFEKDLFAGSFGFDGKLPSKKELAARYGVCFKTIQRILQTLESNGSLKPVGKGYLFPSIIARSSKQKIVLVTYAGHFSQVSALNHPNNRIANSFENECMRIGLFLDILEIDFYDSTNSRKAASRLTDHDTILGFILDVWWNQGTDFRRSYTDVLTRLAAIGKPVAVLDETGDFGLPMQFITSRMIQVYSIEKKRAGERVARFLLGLGHREFVYLSAVPTASWTRDRFSGLQKQLFEAGCLKEQVQWVAGANHATLQGVLVASGLEDSVIRRLISIGMTPAQRAGVEEGLDEFKRTHRPPYSGYPRLTHELAHNLTGLVHFVNSQKGAANAFSDGTCTGALASVETYLLESTLKPFLGKALTFRDATAWVCENDQTAIGALSFLRRNGVRVPGKLSITGFDNLPVKALEEGLTTFDFNARGFVDQMLNFILRPHRLHRCPYRHSTIEVEGIIIERKTTGKPPQSPRRPF